MLSTVLSSFGIVGNIYKSLLSLYFNPVTRVILTSDRSNLKNKYFDCPLGVKQGDILSPTLFSIFVNSLTIDLKNSDCGVTLDLPPSQGSSNNTTVVNHLIYADDLVCIAENVEDLPDKYCKLPQVSH